MYVRECKLGTKVQVCIGAGLDSGKIGVIIDKRKIPTDRRGIPQLNQGHYKPMTSNEIAIQQENGSIFTMFAQYLMKVA